MRRRLPRAASVLLVGLVAAFLLLPVLALLSFQPLDRLLSGITSPAAGDAVGVTLRTNGIAFALTVLVGTPCAYALARWPFPGRALLLTVIELPLAMPPAVAGLGLLVAFGRLGLLGGVERSAGIDLAFTQAAVVLAILFVAGPLYLRGSIAAFSAVDGTMLDVAATLGAGPLRRMLRVGVPLAAGGLAAAAAVALARGLGEFGATILFAGSFQGVTQTLPLAVYSLFDQNLDQAVAVGVLLVLTSGAVLLLLKSLPSLIRRRRSNSPVPAAPPS